MSDPISDEGTFRPIKEFAEDCRSKDEDFFGEHIGRAFLMHYGSLGDSHSLMPQKTIVAEDHQASKALANLPNACRIAPVRPIKKKTFANFISIGRTSGTDLTVSDLSVSTFHAMIRAGEDGRFFVEDAGSRNGTFLNDVGVPKRGEGPALELESGSVLRLGNVELVFMKVAELYSFIQMNIA